MPRGHAPKRETRKPKKRAERKVVISTAEFTSAEVEVVPRRRKARADDESDKE